MPLPRPVLATSSIDLDGTNVELRSLTFTQALKLRAMDIEADRVAWMVSCATGVSQDEAAEWMDAVPTSLAADLIIAIVELSGLEDQVTVEGPSGPKPLRAKRRMNANS